MSSGVAGSRSDREGTSRYIYAERRLCHSGTHAAQVRYTKVAQAVARCLSPQSRLLYDDDTKRGDWAGGSPGTWRVPQRSSTRSRADAQIFDSRQHRLVTRHALLSRDMPRCRKRRCWRRTPGCRVSDWHHLHERTATELRICARTSLANTSLSTPQSTVATESKDGVCGKHADH